MNKARLFFKELQTKELITYGLCLSLTHVLTFYFWFKNSVPENILNRLNPVCWPLFQNCDSLRPLISTISHELLWIYLGLSVTSAILFAGTKYIKTANYLLLVTTLVKLFIFAQDYRLMGNYHYMQFLIILLYFFGYPRRMNVLVLLLICFYFFAGLLKFNYDWLSGSAMIAPPIVTGTPLVILNFLAVLFEVILIWGILSKDKRLHAFTFFTIIIFHLFSWHIVGFFYPLMMLLLIYPFLKAPELNLREIKLHQWIFILVFGLMQILPKVLTSDSSVDGRYRIFALNMFDSKTTCKNHFILSQGNEHQEIQYHSYAHGVRIWCDPIIYWNTARNICKEMNKNKKTEVSLFLSSKRNTELDHQTLLNYPAFCSSIPKLTFWGEIK